MDIVILECWEIGYCSTIDEDQFFGWLDKVPAVKKYYGKGTCLYVEVSTPVSEMDLRELLSVFQRYDVDDFTQLKQLLTEENSGWLFEKRESHWHKKVFSKKKAKRKSFLDNS